MQRRLSSYEITKANGEKSTFIPEKLYGSLTRSGANTTQAREIVEAITKELSPGISTKKIYKRAFRLLKERSRIIAARYNLKNAIMMLGPSGYPFERFVGELMKHQGYKVEVAKIVTGKCINHEVDVIAEKDNNHLMIECKYHNQPGTVSDVKIPLYIQSRFLDVTEQWRRLPGHERKLHQGWVITNTRFTADAIQYGKCVGLNLVGWDYPAKGSVKNVIDSLGLYPITTVTSLTLAEKKALLELNLVLCHDLQENESVLTQIGIKAPRIKTILMECAKLCQRSIERTPYHS
ncbi:MAG TPA: PD-(D/E)XK nuclease superfamily protein [Cyclobacteriaceae bacterium]|nr:PD-(D/E)XK nuclease superfamily protein [Cyclobacteriaceae bacterium]